MWKYICGQFLKLSTRKERKSPESCLYKYEVVREDKDHGLGLSIMRRKEWFASGVDDKQTLVVQNVLNSNRFIDGCNSYKTKSITY